LIGDSSRNAQSNWTERLVRLITQALPSYSIPIPVSDMRKGEGGVKLALTSRTRSGKHWHASSIPRSDTRRLGGRAAIPIQVNTFVCTREPSDETTYTYISRDAEELNGLSGRTYSQISAESISR
jgi:hypothetical protein